MRHRKKFNHLSRKSAHRKETLSSLATSLILHKRINTTLAKAKALRVFVEPLITKSKVDSTHSRRTVFGYLRSKEAVSELFREVAQKVADRPGGYTRILKTGFRKGDSAEMCFIELVDYNANMFKTDEDVKQKTTRRAGRRKKASDTAADESTSTTKPAEVADAPGAAVVEHVEEPVSKVASEAPEETKAAEPEAEETKDSKQDVADEAASEEPDKAPENTSEPDGEEEKKQ